MIRHASRLATIALVAALAASAPSSAQIPLGWENAWPRTDFSKALVDLSEISSGGPSKDGIPPIDDPSFRPAHDVAHKRPATTPVISVEIDGDARAYELAILIWHEIVNDTVGDVPIAVTYCPLCNSAVVFDRRVAGQVTSFGTTGKLRNSDLVMYDRATESWWQQFEGRAILGELVGVELARLPVRLESLSAFAARHPDGKVLVPNREGLRPYGVNPYEGYDTSARPFLFRGEYDGPGRPLMRVLAIEGRDEAWSLELIRQKGPIRIDDLVIAWAPGRNSALDAGEIVTGRDIGIVTVHRETVSGEQAPVVYDLPFAFAFRAFRPEAVIHHIE